jgi:AGZA family xanthine/uracil permease-like MFS transporter
MQLATEQKSLKERWSRPDRRWSGPVERWFGLEARGTTVTRELLGGLTTFAAMSYILTVNPIIMSAAGMDKTDLIMGTAIISVIGTMLIGLMSNLPLALAPGMGANIIFVYTVVKASGIPWPAGLAMVSLTGVVFLLLSVSQMREKIANQVPSTIKVGIQAAVGTLIVFIGLRGAGVIVSNANTVTAIGSFSSPGVLLTLVGILITVVLVGLRISGALILSILGLTAAGLFIPRTWGAAGGGHITPWPQRLVAMPVWPSHTFMKVDPMYLVHHLAIVLPLFFYFLCGEFFGTLSSLIGTAGAAGLIREDGTIPKATRAFAADATATIIGPLFGTSTVSCYIEAVTGVMAGGRTGLVSVVVAALFAMSIFFWPLIAIIPQQATAPSLVMVGVLMLQGLARVDMTDFAEALPVVLMLLLTVLTNNLIVGMALGVFGWILTRAATGRVREVTGTIWGMAIVFVVYMVVMTRIS